MFSQRNNPYCVCHSKKLCKDTAFLRYMQIFALLFYIFNHFEWHTQLPTRLISTKTNCFWTICLLFLNDIHNYNGILSWNVDIVSGLYVYFFWMTYTTRGVMHYTHVILFLDYMFTFFEWHTQHVSCLAFWPLDCFRTICLLFLNDIHNPMPPRYPDCRIVSGLYVYFFWMTYTTDTAVNLP